MKQITYLYVREQSVNVKDLPKTVLFFKFFTKWKEKEKDFILQPSYFSSIMTSVLVNFVLVYGWLTLSLVNHVLHY